MADWDGVTLGQDEELESAAIGVETSYARQITLDVEEPIHLLLIVTFLTLATCAEVLLAAHRQHHPYLLRRQAFLAGLPSLAHAPPY